MPNRAHELTANKYSAQRIVSGSGDERAEHIPALDTPFLNSNLPAPVHLGSAACRVSAPGRMGGLSATVGRGIFYWRGSCQPYR